MALRKAGYGNTLDTLGNVAANTAKAILAIYVASKLARVGMAIARPARVLASAPLRYPWRAYWWWRGRCKNVPASLAGPAPFAIGGGLGAPVRVFFTNRPAGGVVGGSDTYVDGSGGAHRFHRLAGTVCWCVRSRGNAPGWAGADGVVAGTDTARQECLRRG